MACFLAPTAVAIATATARKKVPVKYHLEWLNAMLWGGSTMLAVEHIAHGEIVWYPPFLTAMNSPADFAVMLRKLAVTGGAMVGVVVLIWLVMVWITNRAVSRRVSRVS